MKTTLKPSVKNGVTYVIYEKKGIAVITNQYNYAMKLEQKGYKALKESAKKETLAEIIVLDIKPRMLIAEDDILKEVFDLGKPRPALMRIETSNHLLSV